jgi:hypothetical protein
MYSRIILNQVKSIKTLQILNVQEIYKIYNYNYLIYNIV